MDGLEPRVSDVINDYNICDLAYMYVNLEQQNAKLVEALEECVNELNSYSQSSTDYTAQVIEEAQQTLAEVKGE